MKKQSGIYMLKCLRNDKVYINHSPDIHAVHEILSNQLDFSATLLNQLQQDWDRFGKDVFEFEILEIFQTKLAELALNEIVADYIKEYKASDPIYGYNRMDAREFKKKAKWEVSGEDINGILNQCIKKCDKNVTTTAERLAIIQEMDLDNNETIINYHGSKGFVNKQVKLKSSQLSEQDYILNKYQRIAYYLIFLPQMEKNKLKHPYLSLNAMRNNKQNLFYVADFTGKWGNQASAFNGGTTQKEYMDLPDFDPNNRIVEIDLTNFKHVREILMDYANLKNESRTIDVIWKIIHEFEALVSSISWSLSERMLLHLLVYSNHSMENMDKIMKLSFKQKLSYDQIRRAIRETIPKKIAERCLENMINENPLTVYKTCIHCQILKPATKKYYTSDHRKRDGLDGRCKKCEKSRAVQEVTVKDQGLLLQKPI